MFKSKNWPAIVSVILAIICAVFDCVVYMTKANEGLQGSLGDGIGTLMGMGLIAPYLLVSTIGTILHAIGGFVYKKGLFLAGLIMQCVSIVLMITWGYPYILVIIFGFIGYARMRKSEIPKQV